MPWPGARDARSRAGQLRWSCAAMLLALFAACDSTTQAPADSGPASSPSDASAPSGDGPPVIVPAPAVTQASWAPDALEELLAPIALYPDALLGQILAASVNSQEVLDAGNWLVQNPDLEGQALDDERIPDRKARDRHSGQRMGAAQQAV